MSLDDEDIAVELRRRAGNAGEETKYPSALMERAAHEIERLRFLCGLRRYGGGGLGLVLIIVLILVLLWHI